MIKITDDINLFHLLIISTLIIFVFMLSEILKRRFNIKVENTRKFAHIGAGIVTLIFPFIFTTQLPVLILSFGFLILLVVSKKFHFLDSINGIPRLSFGSLVYPMAIYICFYVYCSTKEQIYYFLPVLIFILCDPLAAYVGIRTKWFPYHKKADSKTFSGSLSFFVGALLLSICIFSFQHNVSAVQVIFLSLMMAMATTIVEALSPWGLDNLFVPLISMLVLQILNI